MKNDPAFLEPTEDDRTMRSSQRPLLDHILIDLFDYLEDRLDRKECDHTMRHTEAFLADRRIAPNPVLSWLNGMHAGCDCEVLENVELTWHAQD